MTFQSGAFSKQDIHINLGSWGEQLNLIPCADTNSLSIHYAAALKRARPLEPARPWSKSLRLWKLVAVTYLPESQFPHSQKRDMIPCLWIGKSIIFYILVTLSILIHHQHLAKYPVLQHITESSYLHCLYFQRLSSMTHRTMDLPSSQCHAGQQRAYPFSSIFNHISPERLVNT